MKSPAWVRDWENHRVGVNSDEPAGNLTVI
jgi:hypothetical protein